jgi:hypothetical protein
MRQIMVISYWLNLPHLEIPMTHSNSSNDRTSLRRKVMTRHASKRAQQRGIGAEAVPLITAYGEREHDGRGGIRVTMTEDAMRRLERAVGRSQRLDGLRGTYVVLSALDSTTVVTTGHRW